MKIAVLDSAAMGNDLDFNVLAELGEYTVYKSTSQDEILSHAQGADALILNKVRIGAPHMDALDSLKLICVFATGYDNIDINAARERGIAVCNVPAYSTDSVAVMTVATVLSLVTHLAQYRSYTASGEYTRAGAANCLYPVYNELRGKTWGIVGYGNIGKAVAAVASAFGCKVLVCKRTPVSDVCITDIDTLCKESDIITLHCPLNDSTRGIISESRIASMKPGVILVNEARGAVVDEYAVAEAVKSGAIGGFGCDVYSEEPYNEKHPYAEIAGLDSVCLTPHCAWGAIEARERCLRVICDNIRSFSCGERLNRIV